MIMQDALGAVLACDPDLTAGSAHPSAEQDLTTSPPAIELPILPLQNTVLIPNTLVPLFVACAPAIRAIEEAMAQNRMVLAVAQRTVELEHPGPDDLYTVGTEAIIVRLLRMPDGTLSVLVQGQRRMRILEYVQQSPYLRALALPVPEHEERSPELEALRRAVTALFEKYARLNHNVPEETYITALNIDRPGALADFILSSLDRPIAERQHVLETFAPVDRLQRVTILLSQELDILELENQIHSQVQQEVDKTQREYFLREQLKAIQRELGEHDPTILDGQELREQISASGMPDDVRARAEKELERLLALPSLAPDGGVIRAYLDWLIALPWQQASEDRLDLAEAARILSANHYGLEKVKERILEYIAVRKLSQSARSPILCFAGPPGVGKTSLGRSIAQALNRRFVRLSLGGIHDEAEIRGHRRTYVGALPGRIIQTMRLAGTVNPLFMLDEVDKIGADFRGDPAAALLEVLDPEQNHAFSDHYLEVPYDLSRVLFIATVNVLHTVPPALRDRMEVIELPGYIEDEKLHIARQFLLPRLIHEHGLTPSRVTFTDDALLRIIREYTYEAGVRSLERQLGSVLRKIARAVAEGKRRKTVITGTRVPTYLGPQQFFYGQAEAKDDIGIATGVAWTSGGGDLITVEALVVEGRGNLILTGQLGEVMRESAQAALSYARARAGALGLEDRFWEKRDIHLHLPSAGIPKDGPSAGITMATALISALAQRPAHRHVAMTGEITLRGRILPVGGIKEKVLAAHRAGIKTVILPKRNLKDLEDVPPAVRSALQFIAVECMDEVLPVALHPPSSADTTSTPLSRPRRSRPASLTSSGRT